MSTNKSALFKPLWKSAVLLLLPLSACSTVHPGGKASTGPSWLSRAGTTNEHVIRDAVYLAAATQSAFALATVTLSGPTVSIRFFDVTWRPQPITIKP